MTHISSDELNLADIPATEDWEEISRFALTFDGYGECGSFEACAQIANEKRNDTLAELRACLFFEQRRWRHFGEKPDAAAMDYIKSLLSRMRELLRQPKDAGSRALDSTSVATSRPTTGEAKSQLEHSFPQEVRERLGYYVYRLIDPRNGETFYVGKGRADRVFHHVRAELAQGDLEADEDAISAKLARIRDIRRAGLDVIHIIQRHGMTSDEALLVEAALIDAFPGLSNIQGGQGNSDVGVMHADAIIRKYCAPKLVAKHRIVFFTVRRSFVDERGEYEACRGVWRMSRDRAEQAELVMPVVDGIVAAVFHPVRWLEATPANFPNHISEAAPGRFGFEGTPAEEDVWQQYVRKRLPDELVGQRKSQNPVRYSY